MPQIKDTLVSTKGLLPVFGQHWVEKMWHYVKRFFSKKGKEAPVGLEMIETCAHPKPHTGELLIIFIFPSFSNNQISPMWRSNAQDSRSTSDWISKWYITWTHVTLIHCLTIPSGICPSFSQLLWRRSTLTEPCCSLTAAAFGGRDQLGLSSCNRSFDWHSHTSSWRTPAFIIN